MNDENLVTAVSVQIQVVMLISMVRKASAKPIALAVIGDCP